MIKTYPEVNAMSLKDVQAAIAIGEICLPNVIPAAQPELRMRLAALRDRAGRLMHTQRNIDTLRRIRTRR